MLPLGLTVSDVDQAAADADWRMFVLAGPRPVQDGLSLVLVEEERMGAQHGEDAFPWSHATSYFLQQGNTETTVIPSLHSNTNFTW